MKTLVIKIDSDDSEKVNEAISDMQKQLGVLVVSYELNDTGSKKVEEIINS